MDTRTARAGITLPHRQLFIDGRWVDALGGGTYETADPAREEVITAVAAAEAPDVDAAVRAARAQFDDGVWPRLPGAARGAALLRLADLVDDAADELADLEALEIGKPQHEARAADIPQVSATLRHFAALADSAVGEVYEPAAMNGRDRISYTLRQPAGVVAAITPWNAPTMIASWKLASALAAGCTVVLKPPEDAALSTLRLVELVAEADFPPGTVNLVPGLGATAGAALAAHDGVDKVSFTGSPEVGRSVAVAAAHNLARVTLELGGKSPQLVFPDADIDAILPTVAASVFANQGEICAAGSRILVHRSRHEELLEALAALAGSIVVGDPFDPATTMGTLINRKQFDRVSGYIDTGRREGAALITGGERVGDRGYFIAPTVFSGHNDATIAREEIFGPVATVIPFDGEVEAVRLANATVYGLIAVVWTRDMSRAHRVAKQLRVGTVWINGWGAPDPRLPWGGIKRSGVGRELGLAGLRANTEEKVVSLVL